MKEDFSGRGRAFLCIFCTFLLSGGSSSSIVTATTEYGTLIHASVEKGNIFACQFHPEKSSRVGMKILQNFIEITQEFREKDKQGGR